jgi:hypothetical protein
MMQRLHGHAVHKDPQAFFVTQLNTSADEFRAKP